VAARLALTVASIQYHTAIVQLFIPVLESGHLHPDSRSSVRSLVMDHARQGAELVEQSRRRFSSCRFHMPLTTFCAVYLCDTLVRYRGDAAPAQEAAALCLDVLQRTRAGFAFCGPLQQMFRDQMAGYGLDMPEELEQSMGPRTAYSMDEILDVCTRLSYAQPTDQIRRYVDRQLGDRWAAVWTELITEPLARRLSTGGRMEIQEMLNG
jgi:hypothetical protein